MKSTLISIPHLTALPFALLVAALLHAPLCADILHVDAFAPGGATGANWNDAYPDLESALAVAVSGDEIRVARGTYLPSRLVTAGDPRSATFQLVNGVALYGGFSGDGTETLLSERDPATHVTILSGDLLQDDASGGDRSENAYHVLLTDEALLAATLDGFTITAGNADGGFENNIGGALSNEGTSAALTIVDCVFCGNSSSLGGGAVWTGGSGSRLSFLNCRFEGNWTGNDGGAIDHFGGLTLTGCCFVGNEADDDGGAVSFEGISVARWQSPIHVTDCEFLDNNCSGSGGALYIVQAVAEGGITGCKFSGNHAGGGGGLLVYLANIPVTDCCFEGNTASSYGGAAFLIIISEPFERNILTGNSATRLGGGLLLAACELTVKDCLFSGNTCNHPLADRGFPGLHPSGGALACDDSNAVTVVDSVFTGNSAYAGGAFSHTNGTATDYINCTVSGNHSASTGGALWNEDSAASFTNSILWNNEADSSTSTATATIELVNSTAIFFHSLVANSGGSLLWDAALGADGGNNIDEDPTFVMGIDTAAAPTTNGDFRLLLGSPALDVGDDAANTEPFDIAGNPRKDGTIDLGAYEGAFVIDETPPSIVSASADPGMLWPPNGKLVQVAVEAQVTDNDGVATWRIEDVTCNERFKYGDIVIDDDHTLHLRATRAGSNREGRIYTVILIAEDPAGNRSEPYEVNVVVPHDRKPQRH